MPRPARSSALGDFPGVLVATYGDMPLVTSADLRKLFRRARRGRHGDRRVPLRRATAYGRVILDRDGLLDRIVEFKDATREERAVDLCNAGIMAADAKSFFRWAAQLKTKTRKREYYLTDIPTLAKRDGVGCAVVEADEADMIGVNSRAELAAAEARDAEAAARRGARRPASA